MNQPAPVVIRPCADADLDAVITVFLRGVREIAAQTEARAGRSGDLEPDGPLDMMFVHPDHQGRGVATAPPATVEAAARALDLAKIFTEASLTAWPFFEKRGQVLRGFRMRERLTAI